MKTLHGFVHTLTPRQQQEIDEALSRAVYAGGHALSMFDNNRFWEEALKKLNPAYNPPSAYRLSQPLLEAEVGRVMKAAQDKRENALSVTLLSDGWKNIVGDKVINMIVCTPEPVFHDTVYPGSNRETSVYVAKILIKGVNEVGSYKVLLIVTDNAMNMKAAWELVRKEFPHIFSAGCTPHGLNLLAKDIMKIDKFASLMKTAKAIVKIKNKSVNKSIFKKNRTRRYGKEVVQLKMPNPTRFSGNDIMLESLEKNKCALQDTVLDDNADISYNVKSNVLDDNFWKTVRSARELLIPISKAVKVAESDNARVSIVPRLLMDVKQKIINNVSKLDLTETEQAKIIERLRFRMRFICYDIHLAAYILDPRFRGEGLSHEEFNSGLQVIESIAEYLQLDKGKVIANVLMFRNKAGFFESKVLWDTIYDIEPHLWWQGACKQQFATPVACRILTLVPSTAPAERNWALYGDVHNKKRNRLGKKTAKRLVAVKSNLILTHPQMFLKQAKRRCEGNIDHYIKNVRPVSLFSTYDFNEEEDDVPLYLIGVPESLVTAWNETDIERELDEDDFDENVDENENDYDSSGGESDSDSSQTSDNENETETNGDSSNDNMTVSDSD